jgi:2-methylcitrate dehydratase PrpD
MTTNASDVEAADLDGGPDPSELLADFAATFRLADVDEEALGYTKLLALKCAANIVAGAIMPGSKELVRLIAEQGGPGPVGMIGSDAGATLWNAVLANAFFAHAAELEDDAFQPNGAITWTITTVPAAFAVAEHLNASGEQLLEALVVGLEVARRTSQAKSLHRGVLMGPGSAGAAAAAGRLMGLDRAQMRNALGLAMPGPLVTNLNYGSDGHFFESAMQALQSVIGTELARAGCTAKFDVVSLITDLFGEIDTAKMIDGLGETWLLHDFWIKKYPTSMGVHRATDVALELVLEHDLSYDDIERVEVTEETYGPGGRAYCDWPNAANNQEAQVSLQYCVGAAIRDREITLEQFEDDVVRSPRYREAAAKVHYTPRLLPEYSLFSTPQFVVVITTDGRRFEGQRLRPLGAPDDPLSVDQVVDLYRKFTGPVLSDDAIERTAKSFLELETLDSAGVGELFELLRAGLR